MIEEVRKIKLEELNNQKVQIEKEADTLKAKVVSIESNLRKLKREQSLGITVKDKFNFLEKWITRRSDYEKFKRQSKRFSELQELIDGVESELKSETNRIIQEIETRGIRKKHGEIADKIKLIEKAKTLYEMGISPEEAMGILDSVGVKPVLSESDKCVFLHPREYSTISSLICVHKTGFAPTSNMLKSAKDSNKQFNTNITINGADYEYSFKSARDTVHMAMNGEVSSHMSGSWDNCKYAVLIPFDDIPREKIGCAAPMDTFSKGSIELSERTWILCPEREAERLKTFNPNVKVLGYEGENVSGFSNPFLSQLGYRAETISTFCWNNKESNLEYSDLMEREGFKTNAHSFTYFAEDEDILTRINQAIALSKLLKDNHLITKPEDIENIRRQLANESESFGNILAELGKKTTLKGDIDQKAVKGNNKQVDVFYEKMKENGFNLSPRYQDIIRNLCTVSIEGYNSKKRDIVFENNENFSEKDREILNELQDGLNEDRVEDRFVAFDKFISVVIGESIIEAQNREATEEKLQEDR